MNVTTTAQAIFTLKNGDSTTTTIVGHDGTEYARYADLYSLEGDNNTVDLWTLGDALYGWDQGSTTTPAEILADIESCISRWDDTHWIDAARQFYIDTHGTLVAFVTGTPHPDVMDNITDGGFDFDPERDSAFVLNADAFDIAQITPENCVKFVSMLRAECDTEDRVYEVFGDLIWITN